MDKDERAIMLMIKVINMVEKLSNTSDSENTTENLSFGEFFEVARGSDKEFRDATETKEKFLELVTGRPEILRLAQISHRGGGQDVLTHTWQVLKNLDTGFVGDKNIEGTAVGIRELIRTVALYHDLDRVIEAEGESVANAMMIASGRAISEIDKLNPSLLETEEDKVLFAGLMKTCDYFGYNMDSVNAAESRRASLEEIVDTKVMRPLDDLLDKHGIDVDPQLWIEMQYAISRADTASIEIFKGNLGALDKFFQELKELV